LFVSFLWIKNEQINIGFFAGILNRDGKYRKDIIHAYKKRETLRFRMLNNCVPLTKYKYSCCRGAKENI